MLFRSQREVLEVVVEHGAVFVIGDDARGEGGVDGSRQRVVVELEACDLRVFRGVIPLKNTVQRIVL